MERSKVGARQSSASASAIPSILGESTSPSELFLHRDFDFLARTQIVTLQMIGTANIGDGYAIFFCNFPERLPFRHCMQNDLIGLLTFLNGATFFDGKRGQKLLNG